MSNIWLGSIFIKNEGGYEILIRSLKHYKKRLRNIASTPELQDAPMFRQVVEQEAMKTYPHIDVLIKKINQSLTNNEKLHDLKHDIPLLEKSLGSYFSDLQKSTKNKNDYYSNLIVDVDSSEELNKVKNALEKIKEFE
ncbi:MAG: hypothetical protein DWQ18_04320 [Crenarchaeota archaeon]|nr:MAG: hypothetical protein DWQ17_08810 [Thermoproteota archaeon]RDJ34132.1 MAG: hypothetical protein DWQ18_04320 [Thermoproteota archaeon]RDJ36752.1 MAG: hypothetical protein DWQ13_06290 [Thermoproteota archaeon]RDJ37714.1 MAG: hypothetical protein DWQ19_04545 [Thermoproteota archaeon]